MRRHSQSIKRKRTNKKAKRRLVFLVVVVLGAYVSYCLFRPLDSPKINLVKVTPTKAVQADNKLAWPSGTASAIGSLGGGVAATSNASQKPLPTASIAKLITALTVLDKHPLELGQTGPTITLNRHDVELYDSYYLQGGSLVEIKDGEKISEYQALQATLLPSANNMADSLAIWAYGSLENYQKAAQKLVDSLGLKHTTVGKDASGLDPGTKSTPSDLIKLGQAVLSNPVLKKIVSQKTAKVPVAGEIHNLNYTLGSNGMIGIKTGNSDEAKGNFLFAATHKVNKDKEAILIGVIMRDDNVLKAMRDSLPLLASAKKYLKVSEVVDTHQKVAQINAPWLKNPIIVRPQNDLSMVVWQGSNPSKKFKFDTLRSPTFLNPQITTAQDYVVGKMTIGRQPHTSSVPLVPQEKINPPGLIWRLSHPF